MEVASSVNSFDYNTKYKLYRNVNSIIHPTISKRNITDYRLVVNNKCLPLYIYYPNKLSVVNGIIIYVHGREDKLFGRYSDVCDGLAKELNELVIAIDYDNVEGDEIYNKCKITIDYLYQELVRLNVDSDRIVLMGDYLGSDIVLNIAKDMDTKLILINPSNKNINSKSVLVIDSLSKELNEVKKFL